MSFPSRELDNWITTKPADQPRIQPTKVSEYDAYDETKLDWRLRLTGLPIAWCEQILSIVSDFMQDEENFLRKDGYQSALNTANSLKTIRENRLRNK
jgi:hypothetical protein